MITDEIRSWIGREVSYEAPEEIGRASIRYFAIAVGDENPLYLDDDFARSKGHPSLIAPPTFVCETSQYMSGPRDRIGHTWDIPITGCRLIRGGNDYEFHRPVLPEDKLVVTWRVADIAEKKRPGGASMLVVKSEATYRNQSGDVLAKNTETLIYQPLE